MGHLLVTGRDRDPTDPRLRRGRPGRRARSFPRVSRPETRPRPGSAAATSAEVGGRQPHRDVGQRLGRAVEDERRAGRRAGRPPAGRSPPGPARRGTGSVGVAHRLERGVLGQVVADVVGEDLVDDHRRHDHRDEDAEGEDLAGGRLADPVVLLAIGRSSSRE